MAISERQFFATGTGSSPMKSMAPEVRTLLARFRDALERTRLPGDAHDLAAELVGLLIALHDGGTLTAPFLKMAIEPFHELPQVVHIVSPLVRFAAHESVAMGHREFQRSDSLPWIASSYSDLEPKATLDGLSGLRPSDCPPQS